MADTAPLFSRLSRWLRPCAPEWAAVTRAQAVIEFALDGAVLTANPQFLSLMGYSRAELQGKHHHQFLSQQDRDAPAYAAFWQRLRQGEHHSGQFPRVNRAGQQIWLQATYAPVLDGAGRVTKIVKFATDITAQQM